jgi:hypothetical protein
MKYRKVKDDVKTGVLRKFRDEFKSTLYHCLSGIRYAGGASYIEALIKNMGTCRSDVRQLYLLQRSGGCQREKLKLRPNKSERTNAENRGGLTGSSEEAFVMNVERSSRIIQLIELNNQVIGKS